jgi:hypothetical protein
MNKEEFIRRRGKSAYMRMLELNRENRKGKPEEGSPERSRTWREEHPAKVIENNRKNSKEICRKGGKYYEKYQKYKTTGISGKKNRVRSAHGKQYLKYKNIIAPGSQIHHEWIPGTAKYTGVALVEADQHMYGFIKVIEVLDGKITRFTEKEILNRR